MKFNIGQFLKLDDSYYIVKGVTESGKPNQLIRANKYGINLNEQLLTNNDPNGWNLNWELAKPMDPKHAKYEKVIAKMKQLDRKFQNRDLNKKDLTHESILDILTRLARQQHDQS